jgi:hypothetical protein
MYFHNLQWQQFDRGSERNHGRELRTQPVAFLTCWPEAKLALEEAFIDVSFARPKGAIALVQHAVANGARSRQSRTVSSSYRRAGYKLFTE